MIAYRCQSSGGQKDFSASYTVTTVHDNAETKWPSSCAYMFFNNTSFNEPVEIGNNVISCAYMLSRCSNYNHDLYIPDSVVDSSGILSGCTSFAKNIKLSNNTNRLLHALSGTKFNQDITIPESVMDCYSLLGNDVSFGKNIYFKGNTYRNIRISSMLEGTNNSKRKNIFFNQALNNKFNGSSWLDNLSWVPMTNGFYDANYNIYCYYNYAG